MKRVLMVCLGNICRSPLAQGILEQKVKEHQMDWLVDSAGTSSWHAGEAPDPRSIQKAAENGINIRNQRSRQFQASDFDEFDLILTMDQSNHQNILSLARTQDHRQKVQLILNYLNPGSNQAVPDPYYDNGFERVFQLLDAACEQVIAHQGLMPSPA